MVYKEVFRQARQDHLEVLFCDEDESDTKMFGYSFILQNLIDIKYFNKFVKIARQISFENQQVIRDIQDYLIVESLRSVGKEYFLNKHKASQKMKFYIDQRDTEEHQALKTLKPPLVWNYYQSQREQQKRFFSVDPFKEFPDLGYLNEELENLGNELLTYNPDDWGNFQTQLIKFFKHQN